MKENVNDIMKQLISGKISKKEAVDKTCNFVCSNYKVFGLEKYDEDFRSDLLLSLLEKGEEILDGYKPQLGDYFGYLYMTIDSLKLVKLRVKAKLKVRESFILQNGPVYLAEKEFSYTAAPLTPLSSSSKKAYIYKPIPAEMVRKTLTNIAKDNKKKKLLIIALKTSFYLTDEHIARLSTVYNLSEEEFHLIIQHFKNLLMEKADRKQKLLERRNNAYFHIKNYEKRMELVRESEKHYDNVYLLKQLESMLFKHQRTCNRLNKKLLIGCIMLRPTNKLIADYTGLRERQVAYHIKHYKDKLLPKARKKNKTKDSDLKKKTNDE